jgi:hypothetical protein
MLGCLLVYLIEVIPMKNKMFALATAVLLLANSVGFVLADTKPETKRRQAVDPLVAMLPESEAVAVFDAARFFSVGLPQLLSANQPLLAEMNAKLDKMQSDIGIDLRKFERVAMGLSMAPSAAKKVSAEPVVIARGSFTAGALLGLAKIASNGGYREEKIGARTIYIFTPKNDPAKTGTKPGPTPSSGVVDQALDKLSREIAVTALDDRTLAVGTVERVRQTVNGRTHVANDVTALLPVNSSPILSFAARIPVDAAKSVTTGNDELANNINSIRYMWGTADAGDGSANLQVSARTTNADQAQKLLEMLQGLQMVGKSFLGSAKTPDKLAMGRIIDSAKLVKAGNDVSLSLVVPQSDIDLFIGAKK